MPDLTETTLAVSVSYVGSTKIAKQKLLPKRIDCFSIIILVLLIVITN